MHLIAKPGEISARRVLQQGAVTLAHGGSWFLWTSGQGPLDQETFARALECARFVRSRAAALGRPASVNPVAVLVSETAWERERCGGRAGFADLIAPQRWALILEDALFGVDLINEADLALGAGPYRAIVVPDQRAISAGTLERLRRFAAGGGTLVLAGATLLGGGGEDPGFHAHLEGATLSHSLGRPPVNNVPLLLLAVTDITERKSAENKRLQLERQMQETQKLESLGVLAGGIAHDFNNLLTVILGNASLALDELPPTSAAGDNLKAIEHTALRAAELCRQMLAYSGKGRFVIEAVELGALIQDMVSLLKASISKKAMLHLNLAESLPSLRGDPSQIRQIVMNLVINASEALGEHAGTITLATGLLEASPEPLAGIHLDEPLAEGPYVWLEVSDTGCGMDPETRRRIFEPFFTTKFTGRGLGLSAVLGIVRGHQGALKVQSEPGKGTSFKVLFPAAPQEVPTPPRSGEPKPGLWKGAGTILLVDDEESVRTMGRRMLERSGFQVLTAADGRAALEIYRARRGEIALVLLDLTMPDLDGEETFHELRQIDPNVRVVMSSGYTESEIIPRFAGQGLTGFLQKPYTTAALMECLRGSLGGSESS